MTLISTGANSWTLADLLIETNMVQTEEEIANFLQTHDIQIYPIAFKDDLNKRAPKINKMQANDLVLSKFKKGAWMVKAYNGDKKQMCFSIPTDTKVNPIHIIAKNE